jgi:hypothetical protein
LIKGINMKRFYGGKIQGFGKIGKEIGIQKFSITYSCREGAKIESPC